MKPEIINNRLQQNIWRFNPARLYELLGFAGMIKIFEITLLRRFAFTHCYHLPDTISIEATNRCQLKCAYCFWRDEGFINPELGDMGYEDFVRVAKQIKGVRRLWFSGGGEPLLNKDLVKMLRFVRSRKIARRFGLNSNGLLLTPEITDQILNAAPDFIWISFDSPDPEIYESIARGAKFEIVKEHIRYLAKKAKPFTKVVVNAVITDENRESMRLMPEWLRRKGVRFLHVQRAMVPPLDRSRSPVGDLNEWISDLRNRCKRVGIHFEYDPMRTKKICHAPFRWINITWDGKITPCHMIERLSIGNSPFDFTTAWNGQKIRDWRKRILRGDTTEVCRSHCRINGAG